MAQTPLPTPASTHYTFRFKHHKHTVLLALDPTTSFTNIKSLLLTALLSTASLTTLSGHSISSLTPSDIELGLPIDQSDLDAGWTSLESYAEGDSEGDEEEMETKKRKKKPGRPSTKGQGVRRESPMGAGLKDGAAVAFRFRGGEEEEGEWDVVVPRYEDEEGKEEMDEEEG